MTDTDRIESESTEDSGALDEALEQWDEFTDDEGVYEDFLDWLNAKT